MKNICNETNLKLEATTKERTLEGISVKEVAAPCSTAILDLLAEIVAANIPGNKKLNNFSPPLTQKSKTRTYRSCLCSRVPRFGTRGKFEENPGTNSIRIPAARNRKFSTRLLGQGAMEASHHGRPPAIPVKSPIDV